MIRRWHSGHSIGIGVVIGVLLTRHSWLLVALGLVIGFVARDLYAAARWVARWFAQRKLRAEGKIRSRYQSRGTIPY